MSQFTIIELYYRVKISLRTRLGGIVWQREDRKYPSKNARAAVYA